jgi:hypothetical protein
MRLQQRPVAAGGDPLAAVFFTGVSEQGSVPLARLPGPKARPGIPGDSENSKEGIPDLETSEALSRLEDIESAGLKSPFDTQVNVSRLAA